MRKSAMIALVAASYTMLIGILLLIVLAVTTAIGDGWRLRAQAALVVDHSPQFSPDGSQVAFLRTGDGPSRLWVIGDDGTDAHPLAIATRYSWRGAVLVFSRGTRLYRIRPDGGSAAPTRGTLAPARLVSRRRTLYVHKSHVWLRDASGRAWELT